MPDIHISKTHSLPLQKAKEVALEVADQLKKQYDLKGEWLGNALKFHKAGIKGELVVENNKIDVRLSLSLPFTLFRQKIQSEIERNLDDIFGSDKKAKTDSNRK